MLQIFSLHPVDNASNLARTNPHKDAQDEEHKKCIKHPEIYLMREEISIEPLRKLHRPEQRPHQNKRTRSIQGQQMAFPRQIYRHHACGWVLGHAHVEDGGDGDEQSEDYDLNDQTGDDDVLAGFDHAGLGHETRSAGLYEEGEDVAGDENFGEPFATDERV